MLVTVKTLQQQIFKVQVEGKDTVRALKEKIEAERGRESFPVAGQKLIYAGKILDDEKTVEEYRIEEAKFIVAMVTKPKVATPAKSGDSSSSTPQAARTQIAGSPARQSTDSDKPTHESGPGSTTTAGGGGETASSQAVTPAAAPDTATTTATPNTQQSTLAASQSALVTTANYDETVANIMAFGYGRSEVEAALVASYNNPDRAVEFLLEGSLPAVDPTATGGGNPTSTPAPVLSGGGGAVPASDGALGEASSIEEMIRGNPELQQMVEHVRDNPEFLALYMQQMSQQNPELLRFISEHQAEFVNFINSQQQQQDEGGEEGGRRQQPTEQYVTVTPQERSDIEKLKAMGFPEIDCVQAYMACEKNVENAAMLLTNDDDD